MTDLDTPKSGIISFSEIEYFKIIGKTINKNLVDDHILKWEDLHE